MLLENRADEISAPAWAAAMVLTHVLETPSQIFTLPSTDAEANTLPSFA